MGAAILKPQKTVQQEFPKLLEETQHFSLWTLNDVKELYKRLRLQVHGYALVEAQFESIISFKESTLKEVCMETLFGVLDNDHDGRIDCLELLGGLALCCQASFEDKARFCFELYDFNLTSTISKKEMVMMMMASICGINLLTGGGEELEPDIQTLETLSDDAFLRADRYNIGQISYEEFVFWARSNRDLMAAMESLSKVAMDAKIEYDSEDSAPETDDGNLSDVEPALEHGANDSCISNRDRKQLEVSSQSISAAIAAKLSESRSLLPVPSSGDEAISTVQWKGELFEPTSFKVYSNSRPFIPFSVLLSFFSHMSPLFKHCNCFFSSMI
jgi:Ca2+-binding EF-hand superfamily protein